MTDNEYIIDVKGLTKSYDNKCVVCDVNLQVKPGEIFGFLGPNGSGKTTTIRMLCGLLKPDSGEGTCLGYNILTESLKIKLQVGYMTQHFSLYNDLTIRENLDFIARVYNIKNRVQRVQECVDRLGFSKKRQNQITGTLSGGWKQRLALAAAMLHDPKLLLLDEPTAGVDPKARREFWEQIHNLAAEGITALVSTHYMDEAERCHRLTYIAYGHLLATGNIEEVIKQANLFMWKVTGPNISTLSHKLQQQPGINQVTAFGQSLHVVSQDPEALEKAIEPFKTSEYKWEKSTADLEDVFIHLVAEAKDNFA
ncbi:MAG: ABC transporter ATP-binding protein [Gammaproteobacteria bacterium]|jgi:ABC-2 type transport system ATP-binding protein